MTSLGNLRTRIVWLACWLTAPLICLIVYKPGLSIWFLQDDFAWLGLRLHVYDLPSLLRAIFMPSAHGTFRPFSERGFFLLFSSLFGLDPLPFRIWVFLTMFADLTLLNLVVRRLTGSKAAGLWAAVLWIVNTVMVSVMTWSSAYMQVLCGFVLLLAFYFFLKYVESGERRWWRWQWVVFLFGFGVIETNLVYPALVAAYAWLCARRYFRQTLPLFLPSIVFLALHMTLAPKQRVGTYSLHLDGTIFWTLLTYWRWVFEPRALAYYVKLPAWAPPVGTVIFSCALLGFVAWMAARRRWLPLLFLAWFLILLAPVLPLRDHVSDYYLTLPTMGLACLGAYALVWPFSRRPPAATLWRVTAIALATVFLVFNAPEARRDAKWWSIRGFRVKTMMEGVARARELHPDKPILLVGVDDTLFWGGIMDSCFQAMGISDVYLEPGIEKRIDDSAYPGLVESKTIPAQALANSLEHDQIVVYEVRDRLVNITQRYRRAPRPRNADQLPRYVDVGNPLTEYLLGPTWHPREGAFRWMPKRATLRIRGPESARQKLYVNGFCAKKQLDPGPLTLRVAVDGLALAPAKITQCDTGFTFDFVLPPQVAGKKEVEIALEVDRTLVAPENKREMGLVFGIVEVK